MTQKQVIFDLDKRKVGFVPSNCSHDYNELIWDIPVKSPNNDTPIINEPENQGEKMKVYKWIIVIGILGGIIMLATLIIIIRRCRRNASQRPGVRQYANLEIKGTPDSVMVMQNIENKNEQAIGPASSVSPSNKI